MVKSDCCFRLPGLPYSRRALLRVVGGGLIGAALGALGSLSTSLAGAQTKSRSRVYRIGVLSGITSGEDREEVRQGQSPQPSPHNRALRQALQELGYAEGQNIVTEYRAASRTERQVAFANELAELPVDVLVAGGAAATAAVRASRISLKVMNTPIVIVIGGDPVAAGFVANPTHPGGNVTGCIGPTAAASGKRLKLLKQVVPTISRVAALWYRIEPSQIQAQFSTMVPAATEVGVHLDRLEATTPNGLTSALDSIIRSGAEGLIYAQAAAQFGVDPNAARVVEWANANRLPAMYSYREYVDGGGLMAYTWDTSDQWTRAARYIDKILKGAKPGDLPMERPGELQLRLNLKTARALGLTIPQSILEQRDLQGERR